MTIYPMSMYKRRIAGQKAQSNGALFEKMFETHCHRVGVVATRMPDGCKQVGPKIIRVKTPWDWIVSLNGKTALIDTKTCLDAGFRHSSIQDHQVSEMLAHEMTGVLAGYVIWLRKSDMVIFLPATELCELMRFKGSVTEKHPRAIILGDARAMDPKKLFTEKPRPTVGTA